MPGLLFTAVSYRVLGGRSVYDRRVLGTGFLLGLLRRV